MNLAEKLAGTYLRLNGFLLLPHFTVFTGDHHNHIDLVGLRAARSVESVDLGIGHYDFPIDMRLFEEIGTRIPNPCDRYLGLAGEVKANAARDPISEEHLRYVTTFLGGGPVVRVTFRESKVGFEWRDNQLQIGHAHVIDWMLKRIAAMEVNLENKTKVGSWTLSESALSDFLVLRKLGALREPSS